MKLTLASTTKVVTLETPTGTVEARIWEGHTDSGIPVHAYITRIAAETNGDCSQFERELTECMAPSTAVAVIPLRLIL